LTSSTVRGVIFDLGSTLIDFEGDYASILPGSIDTIADHLLSNGAEFDRSEFLAKFNRALGEYHDRRNEDHIEHTTYVILREVLASLADVIPEEDLLREGLDVMYATSEGFWKPKADMRRVLDQLTDTGYRLGLLSNAGDEANVQRLIDRAGIRAYFDPILISAALGIRKPDPRLIVMILEDWGLSPSQVVMVGDLLETDILGAQRAGIRSIWLHEKQELALEDRLDWIQPNAIAGDLSEVPAIIQGWNKKG
jgi:HAD superfamily hydrolase (TIGR01549 family)